MRDFERSHTADLNMVMCHRSINYAAEMMEKKYGIPWIKGNFIGAESTAKSLRKIGDYFEDQELKDRIEAVITEEMPEVKKVIDGIPREHKTNWRCCLSADRAHIIIRIYSKSLACGQSLPDMNLPIATITKAAMFFRQFKSMPTAEISKSWKSNRTRSDIKNAKTIPCWMS
jgi:hypothetical protein